MWLNNDKSSRTKAERSPKASQTHNLREAPSGAFLLAWHNETMQATPIKLPKKPKIVRKEQAPDQRQFTVVPIRAATDRRLTGMELRCLMVFCSYSNRGGVTWVSLKRIGDHLNVSTVRIHKLTKALTEKGYIRVLYKGFMGERAQTRQIIFNVELSLDDIVAVSGEKPPFMLDKEQKAFENQLLNQQKESQAMPRKSKQSKTSINHSEVNNLELGLISEDKVNNQINEAQVIQLQRAVGPDLLALALEQAGAGATLEQVQSKLKELLA